MLKLERLLVMLICALGCGAPTSVLEVPADGHRAVSVPRATERPPQASSLAPQLTAAAPSAPPAAIEAAECTVKPPAAAASALAKRPTRKRTVAVYAIERERGVCKVRYADGDNEDSLSAESEICDANPCLTPGQLFVAALQLIEAEVPCAGASFCVDDGPTYRDDLVVALTPQ
jgi:hypothetical protein